VSASSNAGPKEVIKAKDRAKL